MFNTLVLLDDGHELLIHLSLLLVLLGGDLLNVLFLLLIEVFFAQILLLALLPKFVEVFFFLRNVLLSIEQARGRQDFVDAFDVRPCTVLSIQLRPHVDVRIVLQVHFRKVAVVTQFNAAILQVVVSEEAGVDMLT